MGQWIKVKLDADFDVEFSAPFSITRIGAIPGYAKSPQTWKENNRVKTLLVAIRSEGCPPEQTWAFARLHFNDQKQMQIFNLMEFLTGSQEPRSKTVWFKIQDVYPGTKYNDTCISEIQIVGGWLP